jgi:hypothetical protein
LRYLAAASELDSPQEYLVLLNDELVLYSIDFSVRLFNSVF